jgi:hypothetical protein
MPQPNGKLVEYDEFIEAQLRKTRSHVRFVDLACDLMVLAAGVLGFFLLAGLIDHWIVPGGLGFWGRLLLLIGLVVVVACYLVRQVLPLLLRRINPLYAAYTIERSRPSLKNALVNFLMFRENPVGLTDAVYQAIEEQAATNLAKTQVDAAVDRSKLIHIGYTLVAILLASALYSLFSPKDLFQTIGRVVMPWAQIDAPTRTVIGEIEPGDAQAFRGQQVTVKARIEGLPADGKVTVLYSSADGQIVDSAVEMSLPPDAYQHVCVLPAGDASLQQSLRYRIAAGDAVSRPFTIEVVAAPTIVVAGVEYKYPSYTGLLAQRVEHQGDIKAIEGTEIKIHAIANDVIQSAYVDFDCDGKLDQRMESDKAQAQATFTTALKPDRQTPAHGSYQLVFKNEAGQQNPQPVRHQIEVTRDVAPEIQFVAPKKDEIDLPLNGAVDLEIVANDPDFALRGVKLSAARGDEPLFEKMLLNEIWRGQLVKKFRFEPLKLGLKAGDQIAYSAVAEDNKDPQPNRTETSQRHIRIVSPSDRPADQDRVANNDQRSGNDGQPGAKGKGGGDQAHDEEAPASDQRDFQRREGQPPGDGKPEDSAPGDRGERGSDEGAGEGGQQGQSQDNRGGQPGDDIAGDKSGADDRAEGVANDGSNDRDAIERILEHQNKTNPDSAEQGRENQRDEKESGKGQQSDEKQGSGQETGQGGQANKSRDKSQREKGGRDEGQGDQQGGERSPSDKKSGGDRDPSQRQQGSKGQQKPKGDERGQDSRGSEKGQSEDASGGQESKPDGLGKAPQDKSSGESKGQGGDPSNDRSNQESAPKGAKGQRQPTDSKPLDNDKGDNGKADDAAGAGQDSSKAKGKPTGRPAGDDDPAATDEAQGQQGKSSKGSKSGAKPEGNQSQSGEKRGAKRDGAQGDDARPGDDPNAQENPTDETKSGQGAQSKGDPKSKSNPPASRDKNNSDSKGGDGEKEKGTSGAGQSGQDSKGSPSPQGKNQPRDKSQSQSPDQGDQKPNAAQSPSTSDRESNSEGQEDGDRSGGGKKGGGQKANKPGTGGAGQNTPADEGAGQSDEAGQGDASDRPGEDRESNEKTGKSGSKQGAGSETAPASGEGRQGEGAPPDGESPQSQSSTPASGNQQGQPGSGAANQPSGGRAGATQSKDQVWKPTDDVADKANLEYARQATDLAITHLKDELKKDKPDPELLNRLNWTRADLEKFIKRWEQMRGQAETPGEKGVTARRELDEARRSLGLRPRATSIKGDAARGDKSQGYKESRRTSPPPEYAEQYKAYTQGTAKGGK